MTLKRDLVAKKKKKNLLHLSQMSTVQLYLFLHLSEKKFGSVRDIKMTKKFKSSFVQIHLGDLLFLFSQKLCHTFHH